VRREDPAQLSMTDIRIEHLDDEQLPAARRLVWRVFPRQSVLERFSFWAIANRRRAFVRWVTAGAGVAEFLDLWGAFDGETGTLLGTTGLYSCTHDAEEAVWLAWFCVAPEARRQGLGSRLLDFSIDQARRTGRKYLRLYTSNRQNETAAQILYESRGLRIVGKKRRLFDTTIYRELALDQTSGVQPTRDS
jgi:GNAT superfamily N-acetyltransferase